MRSGRLRASLIAAACLLLLASCAARKEHLLPEPEPFSGAVTTEVLRQSVGLREIRTLKALADVKVTRNGEHAGSFTGVLGYRVPGDLRLSLFGPFGLTVFELFLSPELFQLSLPTKNTLYEWPSPAVSLATPADDRFRYTMENSGDFYVLHAYAGADGGAPVADYVFDRTFLLNRRIVIYRDGKEAAKVDFAHFNGRVPDLTTISFGRDSGMEIVMREPELDTEIPAEYFTPIERGDKRVLPFQDLLRRFDPSR
ncbi:MAG: hypothetical protein OHK006_22480 [Thermodesulfovibrionales bacterium]